MPFADPKLGIDMIKVLRYARDDGRIPFDEWMKSLRSSTLRAQILMRLQQVVAGNFGDAAAVGQGVTELRIHSGAGYRVYFGRHGDMVVILLHGGDKSSQSADIRKAKRFWSDWKRRHT